MPVLEIVSMVDKLQSANLKTCPEDYQNDVRVLLNLLEEGTIDKLMNNSINLDAHSILDFIQALIEISKYIYIFTSYCSVEISDPQQLRVFSL